jgi:hypothetical protein
MVAEADPTTSVTAQPAANQQPDAESTDSPLVSEPDVDPDFARALAALRGEPDKGSEKPAEAAPDSPPKGDVPVSAKPEPEAPTEPKIDPLDKKFDERFDRLAKNLTKSESDKLAAEQRAKQLEAENARFKELFSYGKTDPAKLFKEIEWDHKKVEDYATGKYVPTPEVAKVTTLVEQQAKELAELKAALAARDVEQNIQAYKASQITAAIPTAAPAEKYPYLHHYFSGDAKRITDEIYGVMNAAYQGGEGKVLTVEEAAHAINKHWEDVAKRLSPRSSSETPEKTPPQKPSAVNAKPKQVATPAPEDADEPLSDDERRMKEALAVMKAAKREQQKSA